MARYFKVIEIGRDDFVSKMGDDLDCCQLAANIDGICYVAVDDEREDEINIDIDCLYMQNWKGDRR